MNDSDKVCTQTAEGQARLDNNLAKAEAYAAQASYAGEGVPYPALSGAFSPYDPTTERKLQIFHTILQRRDDMTPIEAANAAEAVFQKLCIPQPPSQQAAFTLPPATPLPG